METDRDASGGDELPVRPDSGASPQESHDYGYGQTPLEAAGTGGARAADSGFAEEAAPDTSSTGDAPAAASSAADGTSITESGAAARLVPATGIRPVTALRTAPRAVLRPVPEGFPTPPPRPARPNRRPAPKQEPTPADGHRRGLVIAAISVVAILLLAIVVGGGVLAVRAFSPTAPVADPSAPAAPATGTAQDPAGPGQVQIGELTITEVSTEVGLRKVGAPSSTMEPEGEYIAVIFEVDNRLGQGVDIAEMVELETADGQTYAPDRGASSVFVADSEPFGVVAPDGTATFHKVYDVPIGTQPVGLNFSFSMLDETGTLPLGG